MRNPLSAEALVSRFGRLNTLTSKLNFFQPEKQERTEEDDREEALRQLAHYPECQSAFIPMLEERIEALEVAMSESLQSHADLCATQGRKEEARFYLKMFKKLLEGE